MASISFSEVEVKRLILALAGSKAPVVQDEAQESPEHEADPKEDKAEGESEDKPEESSGKPHGESTKDMLKRKLEEKDA